MAAKTIEARLVISGEDKGASASIASVVKSVRQLEEVSKISAPLQRMAKDFHQVEQASKAVNAAMAARSGLASAEAGLKATTSAAQATAKALEQAKVARAAFDGVKAAKGSAEAKQIEAATKAVREYTAAQKRAEGDVRRATAAVAAQSSALQHAEAAATKFGADLKNLESSQQRLRSTTEAATDAMRRQVRVEEQAARATAHHAKEEAEFLRHRRAHGLVGAGAALASGAVGVHGVGHVVAEGAKSGAEVQSNRVDMAKAGIGFAERQHITDESLKLAVQYKNVTQASVMELWKEMRSVMTDPHEVDHIIDPMVRAKSLLDAKDKTGTASHGLNLLVKGAESIGAAKDPERFTKLLDGYIKTMQVMGSTITPESIYEMLKYSKTSGSRWSDRFAMTTAASLGQELGGSTAGNSIDIATKQIVGGMQNLHSKAKEFARIGLIDPKNLDVLKTGEVKGVRAGVKHAVKGDDLAASDLDLWVYKVLLPAMEKHGIKSEADQLSWVQKNFTGTGANVVSKILTQRESFESHGRQYGEASGLAGVSLNRSDPTAGMGAVSKSLETFLGVLSSPMMVQAAHALDSISAGIGSFSLRIDEFNKAHPTIAKFEAPVAAGVGLAGAGLASAAIYNALSSGFGLKTSAAALDHSAILLDAAAIRLQGGTVPDTVKSMAAAGAPALAAFGLGGIVVGTGAAAALSAYATTSEMPKVLAEQGPAAVDPATGGATESNPMEGLAPDRPWLRDWWTKTMPTWVGGSEEAGKKIGETVGKAIVDVPLPPRRPTMLKDFKTKADETGTEAGKTLLQRITEAVGAGIMLPINFVPGAGGGAGGGGGGLIQRASFGPGGGSGGGAIDFGGALRRASTGGGSRGGVGAGIPRFGGGSGGYDGSYTGNDGRRAARGRMSAAGAENVASWMEFFRRPVDQGGMGYTEEQARGQIAMMQGESGLNLDPASKGDHNRAGVPQSFGTVQWNRAAGRFGKLQALAQSMGKDWTDRGVQQEMYRREMMGAYREAYNRIRQAQTGEQSLRSGISDYENPKHHDLAYAIRKPFLDRLRRGGGVAVPKTPEEPRLVKGLDGKEGLDLGNGTMKMPDGSIRSITRSSLEIPDAPAGGIGAAGNGRGSIGAHVEEFGRHVDRLQDMGVHAQVEVTGLRRSGLRATALRVRGRGGMSADLGVSEPGAKEDLSDWT